MIELTTPLTEEKIIKLRAGDQILLSGMIYTARDAAHKRLVDFIEKGENLPFEIKDGCIYFAGPTPTKPGENFGSAGPTTSGRMDKYSPILLDLGLKAMIGKGYRNDEVKKSIVKNKAVYLGAIGGTGAAISKCIKKCEIIAFEDLGPEAIRKLEVEKMALTVIIDSIGNDLYDVGRQKYLREEKHNKNTEMYYISDNNHR